MSRKRLNVSMENLPTAEQFESELKRIRYRKDFSRILKSTISSLLVVAARQEILWHSTTITKFSLKEL